MEQDENNCTKILRDSLQTQELSLARKTQKFISITLGLDVQLKKEFLLQ
jgi:hypothetical protein